LTDGEGDGGDDLPPPPLALPHPSPSASANAAIASGTARDVSAAARRARRARARTKTARDMQGRAASRAPAPATGAAERGGGSLVAKLPGSAERASTRCGGGARRCAQHEASGALLRLVLERLELVGFHRLHGELRATVDVFHVDGGLVEDDRAATEAAV